MIFRAKELIDISKIPERTFFRRLAEIKEKNLLEKKTLGKNYNYDEALKLSFLLGFSERLIEFHSKKTAK